jgi:hypothetical protein
MLTFTLHILFFDTVFSTTMLGLIEVIYNSLSWKSQ